MTLTEALAWVGTVLGLVRTLPQMLVVYREGNLNGLSVQSSLWLLVSAFWWDVYAIALLDLPLIVSSIGASVPPALTWYKLTTRGLTSRRDLILLTGSCLLSVPALAGGVELVGLLASGLTVVYAVPQLVRLLRTRDVSGVSLTTWVLTAVNTSIWAAYGLLAGLIPMVLPALVILPTSLLVMALRLRKFAQDQQSAANEAASVVRPAVEQPLQPDMRGSVAIVPSSSRQ